MSTRWTMVAAMFLGTAMLAGCGERSGVRATSQAEAPAATSAAPVAPAPVAAAPTPAPAPAASPTPAPKEPAKAEPRKANLGGDDLLTVKRLVLAQGVKDREPIDAGASFKSDAGKIYAFVEVENHGRAAGEIVVEFEPPGGGAPHGDVTLAVGAAHRWRTWAYTRTAKTPGAWTAVVKNKKGDVLARAPFEVVL
ncbi:MAG: DUF2914 domain-containing protein [Minicystis sp.]